MNDWICTSGHGLLNCHPIFWDIRRSIVWTRFWTRRQWMSPRGWSSWLGSWEGWWRTNTACQAGWLGVALLLVVLGSWRRHHWGLVHCCTLFLWRQHWGHEGRLGAGWSVGVGACDADGDRIGKVAVGVMDAIEMVVDEQAELGVYQVLAKQM